MKKKQINRKSKHSFGNRLLKGLASCVLAAGCLFSSAGCNVYIVPDPPVDQTQEGGNKEDLNNGNTGNEQGGNNQGNQNQQGGNTNQPTTPAEPDYSMYSQLLQDVLTSDYYNDLIARHKAAHLGYTGTAEGGANIIENIPYNFLESQGEDIAAIKNNDIGITCTNYVYNDNKNELFTRIDMRFGEDKKHNMIKYI